MISLFMICDGSRAGELANPSDGVSPEGLVREEDVVWEFNTRCIPEQCTIDWSRLTVRRLKDCRWERSDKAALLQSLSETASRSPPSQQADAATAGASEPAELHHQAICVIYVHGNWTEADTACTRGLILYQRLRRMNPPPLRFIIYSWPSARDHGLLKDIQRKAMRLDFEAFVLATVMQQFPERMPVSLIGFSFGGAITAGALHLEAGGRYGGYTLEGRPTARRVRVTWMAPAFDRNALRACGEFSRTLEVCEQVVNFYNSCDPVLKRFRFVAPQQRPVAAGYAGVEIRRSQPQGRTPLSRDPRIRQYDCCGNIGHTHSELAYLMCLCRHPDGLAHLVEPPGSDSPDHRPGATSSTLDGPR